MKAQLGPTAALRALALHAARAYPQAPAPERRLQYTRRSAKGLPLKYDDPGGDIHEETYARMPSLSEPIGHLPVIRHVFVP